MAPAANEIEGYFTPDSISHAKPISSAPPAWLVGRADAPGEAASIPDDAFRKLYEDAARAVQAGLIGLYEAYDAASYGRLGSKDALEGDFADMEFSYKDLRDAVSPLDGSARIVSNRAGATRLDPESCELAKDCAHPAEDAWGHLISPSRRRPMSAWMEGEDIPAPSLLPPQTLRSPFDAPSVAEAVSAPSRDGGELAEKRARLASLEQRYGSLKDEFQDDAAEQVGWEIEELRQEIAELEDPRGADGTASAATEAVAEPGPEAERRPPRARAAAQKKGKSGPVRTSHIDPETGLVEDGPSPAAEFARETKEQREGTWLRALEARLAEAALAADAATCSFEARCPYGSFPGSDAESLLKGEGALAGVELPGLRAFEAEPAENGMTKIVVPLADAPEAKSVADGMNKLNALDPASGGDLFAGLEGFEDPGGAVSLPVPGKTPKEREFWANKMVGLISPRLADEVRCAWIEYDEDAKAVRLGFPAASASLVKDVVADAAELKEAEAAAKRAAKPSSRQDGKTARRQSLEGARGEQPPRKGAGRARALAAEQATARKAERRERAPLRFLDSYLPIDSIKGDGPRVAGGLPNPRKGEGDYYIVALPKGTSVDGRDLAGYTFTVPERFVAVDPGDGGAVRLRVSENSTFTARLLGTDKSAHVTAPDLAAAFPTPAPAANVTVYGKIATLRHVIGDGGRRGRDGEALPAPKVGNYGPYYDVMLPAAEAMAALPGESIPEEAHLFFSVRADNVDPQGLIALKGRDRVSLRVSEPKEGGGFQTTGRIAVSAAPLMSAMTDYAEAHPRKPDPVRAKSASRDGSAKRQRREHSRAKAPEGKSAGQRDPSSAGKGPR